MISGKTFQYKSIIKLNKLKNHRNNFLMSELAEGKLAKVDEA